MQAVFIYSVLLLSWRFIFNIKKITLVSRQNLATNKTFHQALFN